MQSRELSAVGRRRVLAAALGAGAMAGLAACRPEGSAGGPASGSPSPTRSPAASSSAGPSQVPPSSSSVPASSSSAPSGGFAHPGLLHTQADFDRMAAKVTAGARPWKDGWDRLVANSHSQTSWQANPQATVYRGSGSPENYGKLYHDIHAAYQNALRWKITGDAAHAETAAAILNAWAGTLTKLDGSADRFLAAGIYGYQFANAAEILRDYPRFDLAGGRHVLKSVFYPLSSDFLAHHNGADIAHYWANWDLCNIAAVLAIGILCDEQAKVDEAVGYFRTGGGNGSLGHAVQFTYPGDLGQWQESGRDQGHTTLGIGLAGTVCEMAWNQGIDLYGHDDNRFMKGCEYVARYNAGQDVPFTAFDWVSGPGSRTKTIGTVSPDSRGNNRPVWQMVYQHYARRRGLSVPNMAAYAAKLGVEGGGGDYGPNSGGFDQFGFGSLTFTR
ncbi:MAG TPA: alginate lyase family protein [Amycolatopsis sp.]|uniref:alginate lyase family protein n=1 Tax=Amycolatopsis sp. TaxID=37632 RepID=UPI002B487697|nr:alginate lyase family protein [Amycolatopsis sp.]HKS44229.1 alginate lyase family protein [Amycolatopsis sp.]